MYPFFRTRKVSRIKADNTIEFVESTKSLAGKQPYLYTIVVDETTTGCPKTMGCGSNVDYGEISYCKRTIYSCKR